MISDKDISGLKEEYHRIRERYEQTGADRYPLVVERAELLKELMGSIEATLERDKSLWNPDISTKVKLAKKGMRLSKKIIYFERDIVKEYEKGNLSQDFGNRFIAVTNLIKDNSMKDAESEFGYFQRIIDISKEYARLSQDMDRRLKELEKEEHKLRGLLERLSSLETQKVDMALVSRHERLTELMERMRGMRKAYLSTLASKPIAGLLETLGRAGFKGLPAKEALDAIRRFLSDYPDIGRYDAGHIKELFGFSEKKLSHVCQETSRFKRTMLSNRRFFEELADLESTDFLSVEAQEGLDHLAQDVEGAAGIAKEIRDLQGDAEASKREYDRWRDMEREKAELSGYSRESLEKGIEEAKRLQGFLRTPPVGKDEKPSGILTKIRSLFS